MSAVAVGRIEASPPPASQQLAARARAATDQPSSDIRTPTPPPCPALQLEQEPYSGRRAAPAIPKEAVDDLRHRCWIEKSRLAHAIRGELRAKHFAQRTSQPFGNGR
jgi:hypothetical protein